MNAALWRTCALVVIAAAIAFVAYDFIAPPPPDYGIHSVTPIFAQSGSKSILVTSVDPHSSAAMAGIKQGDRINIGETMAKRANFLYGLPGSRVSILVNGTHTAVLTAPLNPPRGAFVAGTIIRLAFLLVAALVAWRRPEDRAGRALTVFLVCYGLLIGLQNAVMPTTWLSIAIVMLGSPITILVGTAAAAVFAATFPSGRAKPLPSIAAKTACVIAAATSIFAGAMLDLLLRGSAAVITNAVLMIAFVSIGLLLAVCLVGSYVLGSRAERPRRRWVFLMIGVGLFAAFFDVLLTNLVGYNSFVDNATLLIIGCIPFGLAYAILRHRVIDVGFVLNRAVVYGGVSIVIVGIFVVVEALASRYIERTSHVGSIAVELVVALILGLSVRAIHGTVDRFVDRWFFRDRYKAEQALRDFAYDAAYITDRATLLERCTSTVKQCAGASDAGIWLRDGDAYTEVSGTFAPVATSENDPAILAMRARRAIAELRALDSALPGALGFPMIVRGEVVGVLVCGQKDDDETYAPDEREALAAVAAAVAHGLDGLRMTELEQTVDRLLALQSAGATGGTVGTL